MADQQFCLRWNEHTGTMVKVFKQMLDSQSFVDCTLACEGKLIKAHKMILAACSPYLHTILEENTSKHPIIFLPHLKYSDIRALVDYMYCGEVYISFGHLPSLLKAAEVLRIKGLTDVTNGNGGASSGDAASGATNGGSLSSTGPHNISSSSDHHISSGDTSGTSSASNLMLEQALGGAGSGAGLGGASQNEQTQLSGAAAHNLGQLLGNNLSNLLGAAANNNNNINNINNNNNHHHHHHHNHLLDRDRETGASGDCGESESGNNNIIKNTSAASMLDQSFEDEENEYDINSHMTLDPEVSFADDCSNEDANNEDESTNGESHSKSSTHSHSTSPAPSTASTYTTTTSPHHHQSAFPSVPIMDHHSLSLPGAQQALDIYLSYPPSPTNNNNTTYHQHHSIWTTHNIDNNNNNNPLTNTTPFHHQSSIDKTFLCHLCRCSFTAQSSLRRHMHRHYTDRERFECEICHNSYSRKDYLKEHKKTKHQIST